MKKESGITIVALVITIIVLLILAGVSIAMMVGNNGILTRATGAKNAYNDASDKEAIQTATLGEFDEKTFKYNLKNVKKNLEENNKYKFDVLSGTEDAPELLKITTQNGNSYIVNASNGEVTSASGDNTQYIGMKLSYLNESDLRGKYVRFNHNQKYFLQREYNENNDETGIILYKNNNGYYQIGDIGNKEPLPNIYSIDTASTINNYTINDFDSFIQMFDMCDGSETQINYTPRSLSINDYNIIKTFDKSTENKLMNYVGDYYVTDNNSLANYNGEVASITLWNSEINDFKNYKVYLYDLIERKVVLNTQKQFFVRALYDLKKDPTITSGTGTSSDPFILSFE